MAEIKLAEAEPAETRPFGRFFLGNPENPWQIKADEVVYNSETHQYQATGNVILKQQGQSLFADHIAFNINSMEAVASGNIILKIDENVLRASRIELNLSEEKGTLYDSEIFLYESHFYIKGKQIQKLDQDSYAIKEAVVTSCDGDEPDWKITSDNLSVTINRYGVLRNGTLWARNIPVFYTPFFVFPVKIDRQSGLLIPKFGLSSRKGTQFDQPLYWAINDSSDATFFNHYMTERGNKIGLEYRFVLDHFSKGTAMIDFLNDRKIDDGTAEATDKWGYDHDNVARSNSDRYWFRMKYDQSLPLGFIAKLDMDIVSDQDYLLEFRNGHSGFDITRDYYRKNFGRVIDEVEETVRLNRLNFNKTGNLYSLNTGLKWYDDVIARRHLNENTTLQKMPQIQLDTIKHPIAETPFYWDLESSYAYFYSEDGTNGHRTDVHPRVYIPYDKNSYFSFEPSFGVRETVWQIDKFQNIPLETGKSRFHHRHIYDATLDLKTEIFKIYTPNEIDKTDIRHDIQPRIVYEYIPSVSQDEHPWFNGLNDSINRIEKRNRLTCMITQFLTTKYTTGLGKKREGHVISGNFESENAGPEIPEIAYKQILRFHLEQGYDINEARSNTPADWRNKTDKRPFLPLEADLELIPGDFFSIWTNATWCYYESDFLTRNIELKFWDHRGDRLDVEYRFTDGLIENIVANIELKLTDTLSSHAGYNRNIRTAETIETSIGFLYEAQCWSIDAWLKADEDDRRFQFTINLRGLGRIGGS